MTHRAARALSVVLIALVFFGAVLRISSYIGNPSLWLDEARRQRVRWRRDRVPMEERRPRLLAALNDLYGHPEDSRQ